MLYRMLLYPLAAWMLASTCVAQAQTEVAEVGTIGPCRECL